MIVEFGYDIQIFVFIFVFKNETSYSDTKAGASVHA